MSEPMVTVPLEGLRALIKETVQEVVQRTDENPESTARRKFLEEQAKVAREDMRRAREQEIEAHNAAIKARLDWEALPEEEKRAQEEAAAKTNAALALVSLKLDPTVDPVRLHEAAVLADPVVVAQVLEKMDDVSGEAKADMIAHATKPVEPTPAEVVEKWLEVSTGGRVTLEILKAALM